jgi:MipA family protein
MTAVRHLRLALFHLMLGTATLATPVTGWGFGDVSFMPVDDYSQRWSLAITGRTQTSPYKDQDFQSDLAPLIAYSGETLFLAGTKAGVHAFKNEDWRVNIYAAYRFGGYDRQESGFLAGMAREDGVDAGFDITRITPLGDFTFDATSDITSKSNGQVLSLYWSRYYEHGDWKVLPWVGGSWYSADFNRYYYGVEEAEATADRPVYYGDETVSFRIGSDIRYRIDHIQYLTFNIEYERLGNAIYNSPIVSERDILKLGINYRLEFSDEKIEPTGRSYDFLTSKRRPWSYRIAAGTTTDTKLNEIVRGSHIEFDDTQTKLVSFFGGKQLMRTFFGTNWEVWANLGLAYRMDEPYQDNFFEYVAAIKFFYSNFPWSDKVLTRFGVAEGISYADRVPYAETSKKDADNKGTSHLLNYLDFSFDANLGDIFRSRSVRHCFGGFSVHHRSGIFASADVYGPVDGGSNVNTLYVECLYN